MQHTDNIDQCIEQHFIYRVMTAHLDDLTEAIDALLPQTQCGQCGYSGCRPYAAALARGSDTINKCPPGGESGIRALAQLLQVQYVTFAKEAPQPKARTIAVIDEDNCIGCTLCIQACPVDAIVGAAKHMHTVLSDECTGCELCLAPCPVDCISMQELPKENKDERTEREALLQRAAYYRSRYYFRLFRLQRDREERAQRLAQKALRTRAIVENNDP